MKDFNDDHASAMQVPKEMYMVTAKGRAPGDGRAKTWVRVTTSVVEARRIKKAWSEFKFTDVKLWSADTDWQDMEINGEV